MSANCPAALSACPEEGMMVVVMVVVVVVFMFLLVSVFSMLVAVRLGLLGCRDCSPVLSLERDLRHQRHHILVEDGFEWDVAVIGHQYSS